MAKFPNKKILKRLQELTDFKTGKLSPAEYYRRMVTRAVKAFRGGKYHSSEWNVSYYQKITELAAKKEITDQDVTDARDCLERDTKGRYERMMEEARVKFIKDKLECV